MADPQPMLDGSGQPHSPAAVFWDRIGAIRPYLKQLARSVLGGGLSAKLDPSDVVQRALLSAHQHANQFHGETFAEWLGWLAAIVRNESLDAIRYYQQEGRDVGREQALPSNVSVGRISNPSKTQAVGANVNPSETPSEQAVRREQAAVVLAALERLPEDYRRVVELRNLQDLPYAAVAEQMGRSVEAVRQLWVRAVRRLRLEMRAEA
jgi:RNA polymerase sigma-70 factor (ECF subfamily)